MGINPVWLDLLVEIAPRCFGQIPPQNIEVIIDDITQAAAIFRNSQDKGDYEKLRSKLEDRILSTLNDKFRLIKYYVCLLDSAEYVPPSKNVERLFKRGRTAFTIQELIDLGILEHISDVIKREKGRKNDEKADNKTRENCSCNNTQTCTACHIILCGDCSDLITCRLCTFTFCSRCSFNHKFCNECYELVCTRQANNDNRNNDDEDDNVELPETIQGLKELAVSTEIPDAELTSIFSNYLLSDSIFKGIVGDGDKAWSTRMTRNIIECKIRDIMLDIARTSNFQCSDQNKRWQENTDPESLLHQTYGHIMIVDDVPKRPCDYTDEEEHSEREHQRYSLENNISSGYMYINTPRGIYSASHVLKPDESNDGNDDNDQTNHKCNNAVISVIKSMKLGEADLKLLNYIDKKYGKSFIIRSTDGDMIPILLLNMEQFMNEDGNIDINIWLDRSDAYKGKNATEAGKNKMYINVVQLWREIILYFRNTMPLYKNPIETLVMLMALTKTDYTYFFEELNEIRKQTNEWMYLWGIKLDEPRRDIIQVYEKSGKRPNGVFTPKVLWNTLKSKESWLYPYFAGSEPIISRSHPLKGQQFQIKTISIDQKKLYELLILFYEKRIMREIGISPLGTLKAAGLTVSTVNFDNVAMFVKKHNEKQSKPYRIDIPSHLDAVDNIKRVQFMFYYWTRGFLPGFNSGSCYAKKGNEPVYGWKLTKIPREYKPNIEDLALVYKDKELYACTIDL